MLMKRYHLYCLTAVLISIASCSTINPDKVTNPITIASPSPTTQLQKVSLNESQTRYVEAGNSMAFRFMKQMYEGKNMVCSPLSLQYALAMAANGASGETLDQITDFLGYGQDGIEALNAYSKILLEQLPAVDLDVTLKVTDALLVNNRFPLLPSFKSTVEENYYAAVENMDFKSPQQVSNRINEWASKNTNGFIDKVIDPAEISDGAAAFIMNALYFKAKWAGSEWDPMFNEDFTGPEDFHLGNGKTAKKDMMRNTDWHQYAEMDGYKVLVLPYDGGKFNMYILLPDENDLDGLIEKMQVTSWSSILGSLKQDAEVSVRLPKFDIENKFTLNDALQELGIKKAFQKSVAEFDRMFATDDYYFWIEKIIQKSRIAVSEWGTEAGSVTIVEIAAADGPPAEIKRINFYADRPFAFIIGEETSGTILFSGTYTGSEL